MGRVDFAGTWGSSLAFKESCILIIRDSLASLHFTDRKAEAPDIDLFKGSFPVGTSGKEPTCQCRRHETQVQSLGQKDLLEKEMATHYNIFAWRIPWTEEPDGLQSMRSHRVRHN